MPTYFHVTSPVRARAIIRSGFSEQTRAGGMGQLWGGGIYLARDRETAQIYEDFAAFCRKPWQTLECEISLASPFRLAVSAEQIRLCGCRYIWEAGELVFAAYSPAALAEYRERVAAGEAPLALVRELLEARGHDGLLLDDPSFHTALGGNQAIVYDPALISVSGSGAPQAAAEITVGLLARLSPSTRNIA